MDIHKPKPWHGFREFLKEYLIIVIGVLTALSAEALVENFHERRLSAEAREAVRGELNVNITNLGLKDSLRPCVLRRLDEVENLLNKAGDGHFTVPANLARPGYSVVFSQRWQAATAGGRTSLLSSEEQRAFGRVYAQLDEIATLQRDERQAWTRLEALNGGGLNQPTPEVMYDQRLAVAQVRGRERDIAEWFGQAKYLASLVGVKGDAQLVITPYSHNFSEAKRAICQPIDSAPKSN